MNRVVINVEALYHNLRVIDSWITNAGARWSLVTKVLCGHEATIKALGELGVNSMADSRLANLESIDRNVPTRESWYLRLPHLSAIERIVALSDVSLNSEIDAIQALNMEAARQKKRHGIVIMIELGDLREGILPGSLVKFYKQVFELSNIAVLGIGSNLGCLSGAVPNVEQYMQLSMYKELLELKFGVKLPIISGGSSAVLPLLLDGSLPKAINHFRIGESVFLGTEPVSGAVMPGLRDDVVTVEAELAEIKEKSLVPLGETTEMTPFETTSQTLLQPGQRGYRAVVTVGQLDTDVGGLTPKDPSFQIAGASSDLCVVNVGAAAGDLRVGDTIQFSPNYAALLRLMAGQYVDKVVDPPVEAMKKRPSMELDVPSILEGIGISRVA